MVRALSGQVTVATKTEVRAGDTGVVGEAAASAEYTGMGTTIVALLVGRDVMTVAHVGDSRLYALSRGSAEQLTTDDSWAAVMLARDPSLDPDILKTHPMRNALTSVIGAKLQVDVHVGERALAPDDLILMTTDGVHGVLSEAMLAEACAATADLQELAGRLVREAMDTGSRDHCTAIVARYEVEEPY